MIFHIYAGSRIDGVERLASEIKLTETKRCAGQRDLVGGDVGLERDHLFPPGKCLVFAGDFRDLRHDPASRDIFRLELKDMPRDEYGTLIIALRKKILGLLRKMVFAPGAVPAIAAKAHNHGQRAKNKTARPALYKITSLQGADVAEAIVIS